jgi:hypothetical protein
MKSLNRILFGFCLSSVFLLKCGLDCDEYVENVFRKQKFNFKITEKHNENRYNILSGFNEKGQIEIFEEVGFDDLYEMANIGDSIQKDSAKSYLLLVKTNKKVIKFPFSCNDKIVE